MRNGASPGWIALPAGLLAVALLGCAGPAADRAPPSLLADDDRLCAARVGARPEPPGKDPGAGPGDLVASGFSRNAAEVADAIGAGAPLLQMAMLEARGPRGLAEELRLLRLRQAVMDRIMLTMLDISGMLAAIDCEGERGDQLRVRLQGIENRRTRSLGIASIMVGALTAAVSGGLSVAGVGGSDVAAMTGGLAEASVATALLFGSASGRLRSERNLLRDVWLRPARSDLFPAPVWRYLTRRPDGEAGRPSIAEAVIAAWRAADLLGEPGSDTERARIALLFGPGGVYTVEELEARDAMLDLLEAQIALMSGDLRLLLQELLARSGPTAAPPPRLG
ncbi:hypothetical protein ACFQS7_00255 [Dankookia sp. GCM10030260]|uniref:hypothetical protein n=1 Tax=Dankookia sp. GCM10030260 TaxID=3273390 RepID=UPI003613B63E